MKKHLLSLVIFSLLLTGCSTPASQPEYDEIELATYNLCLEKMVNSLLDGGGWSATARFIEMAKGECKELLPVKK